MTRSNCASAYAIRPFSENVWSLNGSPTLVSPARSSVGWNSVVRSSAIASSIAAFRSAVSSRCPSGAAKTMLSTPPCSSANSDSIRSVARWVSEPGISNSSRSEPPIVATSPMRTTTIASQPRTTRHGWLAQKRVHRARPPVASRSCAARLPFPVSVVCSVIPRSSRSIAPVVLRQTARGPRTHRREGSPDSKDDLCRAGGRTVYRPSVMRPAGGFAHGHAVPSASRSRPA